MNIDTAKEILTWVRKHFASNGPKSSNKIYVPVPSGTAPLSSDAVNVILENLHINHQLAKSYKRRYDNAFKSQEAQEKFPVSADTPYRSGEVIAKKKVGAGNCESMADLAIYRACKKHLVARSLVFLASVTKPGDHAFCYIGNRDFNRCSDLRPGSSNGFIIDPWLNVACAAGDYPARASAQLAEWTRKNKRVLWMQNEKRGWHVAGNGDYEKELMRSDIAFVPA